MKRVLIVDDSSATRAYLRAALETETELEVTEASSGFDALRILPRGHFDLFVVDINMPNINGLELISFIRQSEAHADTPLLVVSTEGAERDRARALSLGANGYLVKPFSAESLAQAVTLLLGGAEDRS